MAWIKLLAVAALICTFTSIVHADAIGEMFQWVVDNGGMMWPDRTQVLNQCNMPEMYFPLLDSDILVSHILEHQNYLEAVLDGQVNAQMEFTVKEVLGNATVTLDDLKYACALSTTRYVTVEKRDRVMMIPIFDLSNHKRICPHTTTALDNGDEVSVLVGEDVEADTELCYSYNPHMRDDYGVLNYGFLPELEDPPRLLQIDHPAYNVTDPNKDLPEEPFSAESIDGYQQEMARLTELLQSLEQVDLAFNASAWPAPGTDYIFDMLMGLRQRRRNAIRTEKGIVELRHGRGKQAERVHPCINERRHSRHSEEESVERHSEEESVALPGGLGAMLQTDMTH
ncbi:hypothetical protein QJQ45_024967 [Haematococcus lacustris]|nr:hypothetical protein QJQ45_024967 [Haematococcus lacustris]